MIKLFYKTSEDCSKVVTQNYSTSFHSAIRLLHKDLHAPIYNVYGFVRLADEIVDSFHDFDKAALLSQLKTETYQAIVMGISLNPILNSFQKTVNEHKIGHALIDAFFSSMKKDLEKKMYDEEGYREYIYGSAEVVGLICLKIFCGDDLELYSQLREYAQSLGAAFQKVNFLRDFKEDQQGLCRVYFPGCDFDNFTACQKKQIEEEIASDFRKGYNGIVQLPLRARFGVYVAYRYYLSLFIKIKKMAPARVLESRVRIPNYQKAMILVRAGLRSKMGYSR
jgi:phytoene/squalene synthetase